MSEIEKMYENAGIEVPIVRLKIFKDDNGKIYTQPPFTAEKQIELIKWLGSRRHIDIDIHNIKGHTIYDISNDYDCITDEYEFMFDSNTFEDALAGLINQVWHSLTEEEKQQVKGILDDNRK